MIILALIFGVILGVTLFAYLILYLLEKMVMMLTGSNGEDEDE